MEFEDAKRKLLEEYGDWDVGGVVLGFVFTAKEEGRHLTEEEVHLAQVCDWLYGNVRRQMHHLANLCEEPVLNTADLSEEERDGLNDYLILDAGDEKIAARANLVKLHEPIPKGLEVEELDEYLDERRSVFVRLHEITVREAFAYVDYWQKEAETDEAIRGFVDEWKGYRELAEIVGDNPPETIGEYLNYRSKLAEEEEEDG